MKLALPSPRSPFARILLAFVVGLAAAVASAVVTVLLVSWLHETVARPDMGLESAMLGVLAGGIAGLVVGILVIAKMLSRPSSSAADPAGRPVSAAPSYTFGLALGVTVVTLGLWFMLTLLLELMSVPTHGFIGNIILALLSLFAADWFMRQWRARSDLKLLIALVLYGVYMAVVFTR